MAFPTSVNSQITDSVTQSPMHNQLAELVRQNGLILQFNLNALSVLMHPVITTSQSSTDTFLGCKHGTTNIKQDN